MHPPIGTIVRYGTIEQKLTSPGMPGFFDLPLEAQNIVLADYTRIRQAEKLIIACEVCSPADAEVPFATALDRVTGYDPKITDYILEEPAMCPQCKRSITEKTLVEMFLEF